MYSNVQVGIRNFFLVNCNEHLTIIIHFKIAILSIRQLNKWAFKRAKLSHILFVRIYIHPGVYLLFIFRGRRPKRWLDCMSEDCKARSITRLTDASRLAADRQT